MRACQNSLLLYGGTRTICRDHTHAMERGKMIVSAEVNGVKGRVVLDTGAPCALSSDFARKAGISSGQEITASDSNGNPVKTRVLMLGSLKLGSTNFQKVQALELDMKDNPVFSLFHIDGLIGYTLLKMGTLSIYGREHKAVFASAAPMAPATHAMWQCYTTPCSPSSRCK